MRSLWLLPQEALIDPIWSQLSQRRRYSHEWLRGHSPGLLPRLEVFESAFFLAHAGVPNVSSVSDLNVDVEPVSRPTTAISCNLVSTTKYNLLQSQLSLSKHSFAYTLQSHPTTSSEILQDRRPLIHGP